MGVSRSGTTLLKEMLDRHSVLAIPTESYFVPQLWDRHGEHPARDAFLDDVGRLARIREWGVTPEAVAERLPAEPTFAQAIGAVYRAYADLLGKPRYGDKTPSYMQRLEVLERAFPGALYVHLVRDGRDAALSFLAMKRRPRFNWARPRGLLSFAAQWRRELAAARRFGARLGDGRYLELRYEDLVGDPERELRAVCGFLGLEFEPALLDYHRDVDPASLLDHPKLAEPPGAGRSDWRAQLDAARQESFEAVAGPLLDAYRYERRFPSPSAGARVRAAAERAALAARIASWDASLALVRRSPAWRLRQIYIRRSG
ncbi:MAG TPA: sulfotransferase [Gaiellaceae bacterium]|nr:sulfotransferase [Gaiellaceae bacterium]